MGFTYNTKTQNLGLIELLLLTDNVNSYSQIRKLSEIFKVIMINDYNNEYYLTIKLVKITTIKRCTLKAALIVLV